MIKRVELSQGRFALIDAEDWDKVKAFVWHTHENKKSSTPYAVASVHGTGKSGWTTLSMHRLILDAAPGMVVDHINHDGLDNRKSNLRITTGLGNNANQKPRGGSSKYKGVVWRERDQYWEAKLGVNGVRIWIGSFSTEAEAAIAYNALAKEWFGSLACLNEVKDDG